MNSFLEQPQQGHWILAKMGKKVLRPGGRKLTTKLIKLMDITNQNKVVEFAPGLGSTASMVLENHPKSYTGIELDKDAADLLKKKFKDKNTTIITANATESTLQSNSTDKVYGEAMLTMQSDVKKSQIIREAHRILKPGGLYGIHELKLYPNDITEDIKKEINKALAKSIKVNARPLTADEWAQLLEKEGFEVMHIEKNSMNLLEPRRILQDEGLLRALKIVYNILTHPKERKRIIAMRKIFKKYKNNLNGVAMIARKK